MAYLVDTNVLVRLANAADPLHATAGAAILELHKRGEALSLTPQVLIEFRNVATRPRAVNGLGLTAVEAEAKAAIYETTFALLPDTPAVYPAWKTLVTSLGVTGKQVHDARLVAVCHVHAVTHLLTFNVRDFTRLAAFGPGVVVLDPATVPGPPPPPHP
ncbi:MAG: type II toxin-antitoxin system VapC family toxin [Gemmataceae bacterium]|nr:type II toxin-antitoxin system VapC family toxin [Gemmataceae bacterium]